MAEFITDYVARCFLHRAIFHDVIVSHVTSQHLEAAHARKETMRKASSGRGIDAAAVGRSARRRVSAGDGAAAPGSGGGGTSTPYQVHITSRNDAVGGDESKTAGGVSARATAIAGSPVIVDPSGDGFGAAMPLGNGSGEVLGEDAGGGGGVGGPEWRK